MKKTITVKTKGSTVSEKPPMATNLHCMFSSWQQAIAKTPAKRSAYQILGLIVLPVV
jgi:hypothetical protein